jgi:hypothetical protein
MLGFAGRSSNLPECVICDKDIPTMWIKRTGGKKVEEVVKKCGTCFNYPSITALKRQHCDACGGTSGGNIPSQWCPKREDGEEKKVELNLKEVTMVIQVTFKDKFGCASKPYNFKTHLNVSVGDQVVVDTSNNGAAIAEVCSTEGNYGKATRWVIQKVDMQEHRERVVREAKLLTLREKLEVRRNQIEDINVYAQYAQNDKKMFDLWNEYITLQGK